MNWKSMARNPWTSLGGIIGLFSQLPDMWGTAINQGMSLPKMPGLLFIFCHNFALPISLALIGLAGKDAVHAESSSTPPPTTQGAGTSSLPPQQ